MNDAEGQESEATAEPDRSVSELRQQVARTGEALSQLWKQQRHHVQVASAMRP